MHLRPTVVGGTGAQRRLLRQILKATKVEGIQRAAIRTTSGRGSLELVVPPSDRAASTKSKWFGMVVASGFADTSRSLGLAPIDRVDVLTSTLAKASDRRLVITLPHSPKPSAPLTAAGITRAARRADALGIDVRRVSLVRLIGFGANALEVRGRLRDPSAYARVLTETAASPVPGRAAYYELADATGQVVMRFGIVNGLSARDRLVAWVSPSLLKRW